MPIPSNLTVTPSTGSNNASISIKAVNVHTGRVARVSYITGDIVNDTANQVDDVQITVNEAAKPLFVDLTQASTVATEAGGNVILTGTSNAALLTFTKGTNDTIGITMPTSYTVNGSAATNNTAISGDPGASAQYTFSMTIPIPANPTVDEHSATITVMGDNTSTVSKTFTINQTAADPYMWLNTTGNSNATISLGQNGAAVTVNVLSNTNWTFV